MEVLLSYAVAFSLYLVVQFILGGIGLLLWKQKKAFTAISLADIFILVVLGQLISATGYALFKADLKTLMWLVVPFIGLIYRWWFRKGSCTHFKDPVKKVDFIALIAFALVAFGWEAFLYIGSQELEIPFGDICFYARLADTMSLTGQENTGAFYQLIGERKVTGINLYHYYEHWHSTLLIDFFGVPPLPSYLLFVTPSYYFLIFLGIYIVLKNKLSLFFVFIVTLLFPFLKGFHFDFYEIFFITKYSHNLFYEPFVWKKIAFYYIIILTSLLFIYREQVRQGVIVLLVLPILSVSSAPAILITVVTLGALLFVLKLVRSKDAVSLFLLPFLFVTILGGLYLFMREETTLSPEIAMVSLNNISVEVILTRIRFIVGTVIKAVVLYLPYIALFSFFVWDKRKQLSLLKNSPTLYIALLSIVLFISSLVSWAVFFDFSEAQQFFLHLGIASFLFLFLALFAFLLSNREALGKTASSLFVVIFLLLLGYNTYETVLKQRYFILNNKKAFSDSYIGSIKNVISTYPKNQPLYGVSITSLKAYSTHYLRTSPHMMQRGSYLLNFRPHTFTYQMDNYEEIQPAIEGFRTKDLVYLPFFQFTERQKEEGRFLSLKKSRLAFIAQHNFTYLIVDKHEVSKDLLSLAKNVIIDEKSGEHFIILKLPEKNASTHPLQ